MKRNPWITVHIRDNVANTLRPCDSRLELTYLIGESSSEDDTI